MSNLRTAASSALWKFAKLVLVLLGLVTCLRLFGWVIQPPPSDRVAWLTFGAIILFSASLVRLEHPQRSPLSRLAKPDRKARLLFLFVPSIAFLVCLVGVLGVVRVKNGTVHASELIWQWQVRDQGKLSATISVRPIDGSSATRPSRLSLRANGNGGWVECGVEQRLGDGSSGEFRVLDTKGLDGRWLTARIDDQEYIFSSPSLPLQASSVLDPDPDMLKDSAKYELVSIWPLQWYSSDLATDHELMPTIGVRERNDKVGGDALGKPNEIIALGPRALPLDEYSPLMLAMPMRTKIALSPTGVAEHTTVPSALTHRLLAISSEDTAPRFAAFDFFTKRDASTRRQSIWLLAGATLLTLGYIRAASGALASENRRAVALSKLHRSLSSQFERPPEAPVIPKLLVVLAMMPLFSLVLGRIAPADLPVWHRVYVVNAPTDSSAMRVASEIRAALRATPDRFSVIADPPTIAELRNRLGGDASVVTFIEGIHEHCDVPNSGVNAWRAIVNTVSQGDRHPLRIILVNPGQFDDPLPPGNDLNKLYQRVILAGTRIEQDNDPPEQMPAVAMTTPLPLRSQQDAKNPQFIGFELFARCVGNADRIHPIELDVKVETQGKKPVTGVTTDLFKEVFGPPTSPDSAEFRRDLGTLRTTISKYCPQEYEHLRLGAPDMELIAADTNQVTVKLFRGSDQLIFARTFGAATEKRTERVAYINTACMLSSKALQADSLGYDKHFLPSLLAPIENTEDRTFPDSRLMNADVLWPGVLKSIPQHFCQAGLQPVASDDLNLTPNDNTKYSNQLGMRAINLSELCRKLDSGEYSMVVIDGSIPTFLNRDVVDPPVQAREREAIKLSNLAYAGGFIAVQSDSSGNSDSSGGFTLQEIAWLKASLKAFAKKRDGDEAPRIIILGANDLCWNENRRIEDQNANLASLYQELTGHENTAQLDAATSESLAKLPAMIFDYDNSARAAISFSQGRKQDGYFPTLGPLRFQSDPVGSPATQSSSTDETNRTTVTQEVTGRMFGWQSDTWPTIEDATRMIGKSYGVEETSSELRNVIGEKMLDSKTDFSRNVLMATAGEFLHPMWNAEYQGHPVFRTYTNLRDNSQNEQDYVDPSADQRIRKLFPDDSDSALKFDAVDWPVVQAYLGARYAAQPVEHVVGQTGKRVFEQSPFVIGMFDALDYGSTHCIVRIKGGQLEQRTLDLSLDPHIDPNSLLYFLSTDDAGSTPDRVNENKDHDVSPIRVNLARPPWSTLLPENRGTFAELISMYTFDIALSHVSMVMQSLERCHKRIDPSDAVQILSVEPDPLLEANARLRGEAAKTFYFTDIKGLSDVQDFPVEFAPFEAARNFRFEPRPSLQIPKFGRLLPNFAVKGIPSDEEPSQYVAASTDQSPQAMIHQDRLGKLRAGAAFLLNTQLTARDATSRPRTSIVFPVPRRGVSDSPHIQILPEQRELVKPSVLLEYNCCEIANLHAEYSLVGIIAAMLIANQLGEHRQTGQH